MKTWSDLDYVEYYAKRLREDSSLFKQQKMLIDSQIASSRELFNAKFKNQDFKTQARKYLHECNII